jgi:plasmid stabilization system protein ParE
MTARQIRYTAAANRDLVNIAHHLNEQAGPRIAGRWLRQIASGIRTLRRHPDLGMRDDLLGGRRRLVVGPWLIIYDVDRPGMLSILRIVHGARLLTSIFEPSKPD